ncbi:DUF397 domain-containing protein [Umezawaea beigongshangensis]|uniref:DUF397 domain-containing protein n=1 Tax=Umezawaea beigongshangensis TaxID=2780383 RepID=UPI0018F1AF82|nr:DUF397 domain-containing protein [Umezawaea beigongshangensis]
MLENPTWRRSSYSGGNGNCVEVAWHKSSYSGVNGNCVEVAWRKSSHSGGNGGCVEVAWPSGVAVRDSKNVSGPRLAFPVPAWRAFLVSAPAGSPGSPTASGRDAAGA